MTVFGFVLCWSSKLPPRLSDEAALTLLLFGQSFALWPTSLQTKQLCSCPRCHTRRTALQNFTLQGTAPFFISATIRTPVWIFTPSNDNYSVSTDISYNLSESRETSLDMTIIQFGWAAVNMNMRYFNTTVPGDRVVLLTADCQRSRQQSVLNSWA